MRSRQQAPDSARVRILHASPSTPTVDIQLDGSPAIAHLPYGQVSDYVELSADRHAMRAFATGSIDWRDLALDTHLAKLAPRQEYTVAVVGEPKALQAVVLHDSVQVPGLGRAHIRLLHASPDAPALDVVARGGRALFDLVSFTQVTPFRELDTGTYTLEVRRSHHPEVIARLTEYPLSGDHLYTLVALGLLDGQPALTIMPLVQAVRRCAAVP